MDNIHQVEIVIHVDNQLDEDQRNKLVSSIEGREGVEKAIFTKGREHLMLIDYDPNKIRSMDVLGFVRDEHINAELVGI
jgi:hypothetical protein